MEFWDIKFYWGIAENTFLTKDGEFYDCSNVNIHDDISGVGLQTLAEVYLDINAVDNQAWEVVWYVLADWDVFLFVESGGANNKGTAFKGTTEVSSGGQATNTWWNTLNAVKFGNDKIILLKLTDCDEYTISTDTCSSLVWVTGGFAQDSTRRPAVVFNTKLYFGAGKFLYSLDESLTTFATEITFEEGTEIWEITAFQNFIKIYAKQNWNLVQYVRDGLNDFPQYITKIPGVEISAAIQLGGLDYIFDEAGKMYIFNWTNYQEAKNYQATEFFKISSGSFNTNTIATWNNEIYVLGTNQILGTAPFPQSSLFRVAPNRVNNAQTVSKITGEVNGDLVSLIDSMDTIGVLSDKIYIQKQSSSFNTVYTIDLLPPNTNTKSDKMPNGVLTTKKYGYENTIYKKKINKIKLAGEAVNGASLELYARTDYNTSRTKVGDFTATWVKEIYANNLENPLSNFDLIQFQLRWTRGDNTKGNVFIRNFVVFYDFIQI